MPYVICRQAKLWQQKESSQNNSTREKVDSRDWSAPGLDLSFQAKEIEVKEKEEVS